MQQRESYSELTKGVLVDKTLQTSSVLPADAAVDGSVHALAVRAAGR